MRGARLHVVDVSNLSLALGNSVIQDLRGADRVRPGRRVRRRSVWPMPTTACAPPLRRRARAAASRRPETTGVCRCAAA
ncbi:MAG: hypothetical protein MZW92_05665 [Comamonadaceae bacterium]|nr:hypothetical protein [Comamonadaceae bacterium]